MSVQKDKKKDESANYPPSAVDADIHCLLKSKYTLLYVVSYEEDRVIKSLMDFCDDKSNNYSGVNVWDSTHGLVSVNGKKPSDRTRVSGGENLTNPDEMLKYILARIAEVKHHKNPEQKGPIYVLLDLFKYMQPNVITPEFERMLRVLHTELKSTMMHIVIVSPELHLPVSLEKSIAVIDYPLPGIEDHSILVAYAKEKLLDRGRMTKEAADEIPDELVVQALLGLTRQEAEDALAKAFILKNKFDIDTILDIKKQIIRKGQLLEYIPALSGLEDLGGFEGLKEFVTMRKSSFTKAARDYGLPQSKGVFMLGVYGGGKSLAAKSIARFLRLPLLKLDMGRLFSPHIGESEGNMRRALKLAESVSPCVLFIDEVDKSLAGSTSETSGDSGTTKRIIGSLLDWMMEKTAPVFVVAAANSLNELPPAFLRKGRFDAQFFVDLPNDKERAEIFSIHLRKNLRNAKNFDINKLVKNTDKFSGAEIEGIIIDAMFKAFAEEGREFNTDDILDTAKMCNPMSVIMKESMDKLREEGRSRMRPVNQTLADVLMSQGKKDDRFDL